MVKTDIFEKRLIEGIDPIKMFTLSICIYHLFETGIYDYLKENNGSTLEELAQNNNFDKRKLNDFLIYFKNEDLVKDVKGSYHLTSLGLSFEEFRPWYTMFIGGYAETYLQIGEKLKDDSGWASRNAMQVGVGSCGISHYDSIPLTQKLMNVTKEEEIRLLDLGCGNGQYLVEFCKKNPNIKAWGVEPSEGGYGEAVKIVNENNLHNKVNIYCSNASEFLKRDLDINPNFIVLGFVLHEILEQEGEDGVKKFLFNIISRFPNINIIVIEVDDKFDDKQKMEHGLAKAYYNPYYLLHTFTCQRLETSTYWERLFNECGLEILLKDTVDESVDSTALELGYLLRVKEEN